MGAGGITIKRGSVRCRGEVCGLARSYSSSLGSAEKKIFVLIQPRSKWIIPQRISLFAHFLFRPTSVFI